MLLALLVSLFPASALAAGEVTYTDSIGITYKATSTQTLPEASAVQIAVDYNTMLSGDTHNAVEKALSEKYDGTLSFWTVEPKATYKESGEAVEWPEDVKFEITGNFGITNYLIPMVFSWDGKSLTKIEDVTEISNTTGMKPFSYEVSDISCLVWVDPTGLTEKEQNNQVTYTDSIGITYKATSTKELPETSAAQIAVDYNTMLSGDTHDTVEKALAEKYNGTLSFWTVEPKATYKESGKAVEWPEDVKFEITGNFGITSYLVPMVFSWDGESLTKIEDVTEISDATGMKPFSYEVSDISCLVWVDPTGLTEKTQHQYSYQENTLGLTLTAKSQGTLPNPNAVTFTADMIFSGDTYNEIQKKINEKYTGTPVFVVMDYKVTDKDGKAVTWPEDTEFVVNGYLNSSQLPLIFSWDGTTLNKIDDVTDKGENTGIYYFEYTTSNIRNMVWLSPDGLTEKDNSQVELNEGHYTVSANMYVKGENNVVLNGTTAYLTNPGLPPLEPVEDNAELYVDKDKNVFLTIKNLNAIFTLQNIEDGEGFKILERYTENGDFGKYQSRISGLKIQLLEVGSGTKEYAFTNCVEFPVILTEDKTMPIHLSVDFSSIKQGFADDGNVQTKIFEDVATKAKVTVSSSEKTVTDAMDGMTLKSEIVTEGNDYQSIKAIMDEKWAEGTSYQVYQFDLQKDGQSVPLTGNSQASIVLPVEANSTVYYYNDSIMTEISSIITNGQVAFSNATLGTFVIVNNDTGDEWINRSYSDSNGTISYTYYQRLTDNINPGILNGSYALEPRVEKTNTGINYYFGFENNFGGLLPLSVHRQNQNRVSVTLPYTSGQNIYYVRTDGTGYFTKKIDLMDATVDSTTKTITFDLIPMNMTGNEGELILQTLYNGAKKVTPSEQFETGYVLVTDKNISGMPESNKVVGSGYEIKTNTSFTYDPQRQATITAIGKNAESGNPGSNIDISGDYTATEVGSYTYTCTPKAGYEWPDGTKGGKSVTWSVTPYTVRAKYQKEVIRVGETPKLEVLVTTMGNGELPTDFKNAFDKGEITLPTVSADGIDLNQTGTYTLTPSGGSAKNYAFYLQPNTLTIIPADAKTIDKPTAVTGLTANGSVLTGVKAGEGYELSGTYQSDKAGTYEAVAKLKEGYYWSDGTRDDVTISWKIEKGNNGNTGGNTETSKSVVANLYVPGEENQYVKGLTAYLTNPNNPSGVKPDKSPSGWNFESVPPTVPLDKKTATLTTKSDGSYELTMYVYNPVFTLQSIEGTSEDGNARVTSVTRDNKTYKSTNSQKPGSKNGRITEITFTIDSSVNLDKTYSFKFTDCAEYPTLLGEEWSVPLILAIDHVSDLPNADASKVDVPNNGGSTTTTTDGATVTVKKDANGKITGQITLDKSSKNGADVTIEADLGKYEGTVSVKLTNKSGKTETKVGQYQDGKITLHVDESVDFEVLDDFTPKGGWASLFTDVKSDAYYYDAVEWAAAKGVTKGTSDTTFSPDQTCTRGQTVTFLWRAAGSPAPTGKENPFTDVTSSDYFYDAVLWAVEKGITKGTSETTFSPSQTVTRAQVVTFQYRLAGSPAAQGTSPFTDVAADSYAKDAIQWAVEKGITKGTSETTFSPDNGCARGQIVTFLYRQLGNQ